MKPPVVVSRCDRLGDLVLSLPALGFLRDAGVEDRVLHCSSYAADIGAWARHNGLCTRVWLEGEPPPAGPDGAAGLGRAVGLSLFHKLSAVRDFKRARLQKTFGPRSRLSALFVYSESFAQHRSRVAMSELRYNLELTVRAMEAMGWQIPEFRGLPALKVPTEWFAPGLAVVESAARPGASDDRDPSSLGAFGLTPLAARPTVIAVSNSGSAANWPLEHYIELGREKMRAGARVEFLVSGLDAGERVKALEKSGILSEGARLVTAFPRVAGLIAYLASASEVISSSTGPLHIAHAAGVPVLGIYPDRPLQQTFARWRPDGYWHAAPVRHLVFEPRT